MQGRVDLQSAVDAEAYNVILSVWGDTPTVVEPVINPTLEEAKTSKLSEVSVACEQTIYAGVEVTTTKGSENFSLTLNDQTNLSALVAEVEKGATTVPYHADGQLCREFTAAEFTDVFTAAKAFITYNTTLCNHLNMWIRRCTTIEEINAITYTSTLPDDLQANFNSVLGITA
jgi:hypothetical protein